MEFRATGRFLRAIARDLQSARCAIASFAIACLAVSCFLVADEADSSIPALERAADTLQFVEEDGRFELELPSGEMLSVAADFSVSPDAMLHVPALAFVKAGLDPGKLPRGITVDEKGTFLVLSLEVSSKPTAFRSLGAAVAGLFNRSPRLFSSWEPVGRYGIRFPEGSLFEWVSRSDVEGPEFWVSFDPEVMIGAGVDPLKLAFWVIVNEPGDDGAGKSVGIPRLSRAFDLK
jgi:hypothetical protein